MIEAHKKGVSGKSPTTRRDLDMRWAVLDHEERSVAEGYGKGFSVPQLKKWIDKIRFDWRQLRQVHVRRLP